MKDEMKSIFFSSLSVSISVSTDIIRLSVARYRRLMACKGSRSISGGRAFRSSDCPRGLGLLFC